MDETVGVLIAVAGAFVLGLAPPIWLMRGFFWEYLSSKKHVLVVVMLNKGGFRFCKGTFKDTIVYYKLHKQQQIVCAEQEAFIRGLRISWLFTEEGSTAPFIFSRVSIDEEEREFKEMQPVRAGVTNEQLIDKTTGKTVFQEVIVKKMVPVRKYFVGWNDSLHVANALLLAAQKPKITMQTALGGMNMKAIIIILGVVGAVFFLIQGGIIG